MLTRCCFDLQANDTLELDHFSLIADGAQEIVNNCRLGDEVRGTAKLAHLMAVIIYHSPECKS